MDNFRYKLASWMQGRYGVDELNRTILIACIVCWILEMIFGVGIFRIIAWVLVLVALWRTLSRDISKRRAENERYLSAIEHPKRSLNQALNRWRNRKTTLYFKCDGCKTWLSVPRGKGTLRVVCPHCKKETIKKS